MAARWPAQSNGGDGVIGKAAEQQIIQQAPAPAAPVAPHHPLDSDAGRPRWQHDMEAVVCAECCAPFTAVRRKHHCRACGRIFCERCVHTRLLVPTDMMARPRKQPATALAPLEVSVLRMANPPLV